MTSFAAVNRSFLQVTGGIGLVLRGQAPVFFSGVVEGGFLRSQAPVVRTLKSHMFLVFWIITSCG